METWRFMLLPVILVVSSLGLGAAVSRWLGGGMRPLERLNLVIGVSWLGVFLLSWLIYCFNLPGWSAWGVTALSVAGSAVGGDELRRVFADQRCKRAAACFGGLVLWLTLLLLTLRVLSGGLWAGDWVEHFERTLFFIDRPPPTTTTFLNGGNYPLTARPPLMNVVAAHVLAQCGARFEVYQLVFAYLGALAFFPLALLVSAFAPRGARAMPILLCMLMLNPAMCQNATFSWTKLFTAFYVLLATWFLFRTRSRLDTRRFVLGAVMLAAALLTHYSAGPYIAFFGGMVVLGAMAGVVAPRHAAAIIKLPGFHTLILAGVLAAALLGVWFGWALLTFGPRGTFATNTTVVDSAQLSTAENLRKIAENLFNTLVPHFARTTPKEVAAIMRSQPSTLGRVRDFWFFFYQVNFPATIGSVGSLVVLFFAARLVIPARYSGWHDNKQRRAGWFWLALFLVTTPLGVAVVGAPDNIGLAHICLAPLTLLGVAMVAARFPRMPAWARWAVVGGAAADFCLGIALHYYLQSLPVILVSRLRKDGTLAPWNLTGLTPGMLPNYFAKAQADYVFLGDHVPWSGPPLVAAAAVGLAALACLAWRAVRAKRPDHGIPMP